MFIKDLVLDFNLYPLYCYNTFNFVGYIKPKLLLIKIPSLVRVNTDKHITIALTCFIFPFLRPPQLLMMELFKVFYKI